MSELQMPTVKQKRDGEIGTWDNGGAIYIRGNYTKEQILEMAKDVIENETCWDVNYWDFHGVYSQAWYKTVPDGSGEYHTMSHAFNKPVRGSFFASCLHLI